MDTSRSKKVFFVSECILNQNIRAYGVGNMKGSGALVDIVEFIINNDWGISVVPCPEISYEGLKRSACGKERYENVPYRKQCACLAQEVINRYKMYLDDHYTVGGYICVNGSPSCANDYCYCQGKTCQEPGILIDEIKKKLNQEKLSMTFIGVRVKELSSVKQKILDIINSHKH